MPRVLFEKSMINGASRLLHKLRKQESRNLKVEDQGTASRWYVHSGQREIDLRFEDPQQPVRATNRCAAILARLFHSVCKQLAKSRADLREMRILYLVSCYDRNRIKDGVRAFFQLFPDTREWFDVERISIFSASYLSDDGRFLLDSHCRESGGAVVPCTKVVGHACDRAVFTKGASWNP